MLTSDFNYDLPPELIAQDPVIPRHTSRLMLLDRKDKSIAHHKFKDITDILGKNDVLVLNNTKVFSARLFGKIPEVGTGKVETLLLNETVDGVYQAMVKPGAKFKEGRTVVFDNELEAEVIKINNDGTRLLKFNISGPSLLEEIEKQGHAPVPPYIKNSTASKEQYQTVYAKETGSAAAPTAGLHFTEELLTQLKDSGTSIEHITLHVGRGTFLPVSAEKVDEHHMHRETFDLKPEVADRLNKAKSEGKRIIAVGTTTVRVLESCTNQDNGLLQPMKGDTDIFIYPGYKWKFTDGMISNFHLPKSSLIMLISSFCGKDFTFHAYNTAIENKYRFYSFGDAMLIL